jgi:predicted nucleic acid-binding protein
VTTFILDASVAMKWAMPFAGEPLTHISVNLFTRFSLGDIDFIVPGIFWAEVGNVLWKGTKQGRWDRRQAEVVEKDLRDLEFQTVPSRLLLNEALKIAFDYDRHPADCFYVALAVESHADLITADERLVNALAARFPVRWLGAFQ